VTILNYRNNLLHIEDISLDKIAQQFGTPCYVYSKAALTQAYNEFTQAFTGHDHLVCYAVKANSNLAILNLFAKLGSGFDIVSGGELARVLAAGGSPAKIVFSGVGKTESEIRDALSHDIFCFNVESESELLRLDRIAAGIQKMAPVSLRVNPDVDAKTHPYISTGLKENKFGIAYEDAHALYRRAKSLSHIKIKGLDCHIGSQLTEISPFVDALKKILLLLDKLEQDGITVSHLDLGGGIGIRYQNEQVLSIKDYAVELLAVLGARRQKIILEPGRRLVGNAGILLTRVEYLKHGDAKNFAIVDCAMNDLMRPALYDAYHEIRPVTQRQGSTHRYEIVGPVCETGDFIGRDRELALQEGDLLAILSAGAYGMSMSSNYNTRPRAAEVMVDRSELHLIRSREQIDALFASEKTIP
jgi:diaminopimelate decarboxylase